MLEFLRHPRFYVPLIVLLLIELFFRVGLWGPFTKPNSYSGQSHDVIRAVSDAGPEPVKQITLGDSRTLLGLDHSRILAQRQSLGWLHVNMSIPGSHLATIRSQLEWAQRSLPELEVVTLGLTDTMLSSDRNGLYELSLAGPFEPWIPSQDHATHFRYYDEQLESLGVYSSLILYREDIRSLLSDPIHRAREIKTRFNRGTQFSLHRANTMEGNLCGYDFSSISACRANSQRPDWHLSAHDDVRRVVDHECYSARAEQRLRDPDSRLGQTPGREQIVQSWQMLVQGVLDAGYELEILLLPEHSLMSQHFNHADASSLIDDVISSNRDRVRLIDVRDLNASQPGLACEQYADLLHASQKGMEQITNRYLSDSVR